jgi:phosphoglycolate phosphatase
MAYKSIIFDLDGTLLDTLEDIATSTNRVLGQFGFPQHSIESYKYFVGEGMENLATRVLPVSYRNATKVAEMVTLINAEYSQHWADTTCPYKGIPELLQELTNLGIKMAVLSNKPDHFTKQMVSYLLPNWRFELVLGARPHVPKKPDPTAALEIAEYLNISPGECLYLGDTDIDMMTAKAAGMYPIGALWGFRTAEELLTNGAEKLILNPLDVLKIL